MDYLKYDVTSQIEIYNDIPAKFPTVTFCDNNPLKTKKAQELMDNILHRYNMSNHTDLFDLAKNRASSKLVDNQFRQGLGAIENFECVFLKVSLNCSHVLHWYWSHEFGNCYQFNSNPLKTRHVYRVGKTYGFKMGIKLFLNKNKHITTRAKGLAVFVHNASFKPTNDAIYIEPGKMTLIAVDRIFTQKYPSPYTDCIDTSAYESELYGYITKSLNKTYRQFDCFELCRQKNIIAKCACYYTRYDDMKIDIRPCLNQSELKCLLNEIDDFNIEECQLNYCPLECESIKYELSLSSLVYPDEITYELEYDTKEARDKLRSETTTTTTNQSDMMSYEYVRSNYVFFTVYYPSFQYTFMSESPKTQIIDLFTQVGGALGMFVSFSIFTLFEFMEIAILILKELFAKN